jgi:hypothetical protein
MRSWIWAQLCQLAIWLHWTAGKNYCADKMFVAIEKENGWTGWKDEGL